MATELGSMSDDERVGFINVMQYDMQDHLSIVEYCLGRPEKLLHDERESERESNIVLEQVVQRRLAASLSSRG